MEYIIIGIIVATIVFMLSGIRVVNQYQRGVVLTLGRFSGQRAPGLRVVVPIFQTIMMVDVRSTPIDVPKQEVITKDNVTVGVDAVVYFRVINAPKAVLAKREELSQQIKEIVDAETDKWGIDVENVKIQNIELPGDMKRAMAKQAEAERERRANIINADGEKAAAETLAEAAQILANTPGAINLRTLTTLERISAEPSQKTMILFPAELTEVLRGIKRP